MTLAAVVVLLAGCLDVSDVHHCMRDEDCVSGDLQGRCEPTTLCSFPDTERCGEGFRYGDRSGASAGTCVTRGPAAFPIELASDSTTTSCGMPGARDTVIEIISTVDQVLLVEAGARVAMALRDGPCPGAQPLEVACNPPSCPGANYGLLAAAVEANRAYCLVVEELVPDSVSAFSLRVLPAGRFGQPLTVPSGTLPPGQGSTTTCGQAGAPEPTCGVPSPMSAFLLPLCGPGQLTAMIDPVDQPSALDAIVSLRETLPSGREVDCKNLSTDAETLGASLAGPGVYWLMVSAATASCGPFSLTYNVTP